MNVDFIQFSLVAARYDKVVYSSIKPGIRPLIECIKRVRESRCTLYDRVIGLAAAKLVVGSGKFKKVVTPIASRKAIDELKRNKIKITVGAIVEKILNKDKSDICPMEKKALLMDTKKFYEEMMGKY